MRVQPDCVTLPLCLQDINSKQAARQKPSCIVSLFVLRSKYSENLDSLVPLSQLHLEVFLSSSSGSIAFCYCTEYYQQ